MGHEPASDEWVRGMFGAQVTLFELLGFKVKVDASWVLLALLVTWSLAEGFFPAFYEGMPPATYWWMGVAGMIGLFFSLVFHELSHSLVAKRYGLPIRGITLFIFGGVAEMEEEPRSPKAEFLMAIAGPIASFLLALTFYGFSVFGEALGLPRTVVGVTRYLALINGMLATFNLLPAFPLDGGRVLRSALWRWKSDLRWATHVAAQSGSGFGMLLIVLGLINVLTGNFVPGMWWFLLGLFLRGAAATSYRQLMTRRALEREPVRRFMTPEPMTVPPETTLRELVEDHIYRYHHDLFPVTEDLRLLGYVSTRQVKQVPREKWDRVRVREVIVPCSPLNTIGPDEDALKVLALIQRTGNSRLMVVDDGRLVGVIALKDMLAFLLLKMDLESIG